MWRLWFLAAVCFRGAGGVASLKDDTCSITTESERLGESCVDVLVLATHVYKQMHAHATSHRLVRFSNFE